MENRMTGVEDNIFSRELHNNFRRYNIESQKCTRKDDYVVTNEKNSRSALLRIVYPDLKSFAIYRRMPAQFRNCEVSVHFNFETDDPVYPPDYMGFVWRNQVKKRTDFLFIKTGELVERLKIISGESGRLAGPKILLWIFPDNFVFVASDLSGEGEWYLLGSGLARNGDRDFSKYLNRWNLF